MEYDIFISYRRKGGTEIARAIKSELEKMGYTIFFDFDSIHDGNFNERISEAITSSKVFLLVLSQNALDSCINENDWLRSEIECAIETNRHIVPINPDKKFLEFPKALPESIKSHLPQIQISDLMLGQLFQASLDKVIKERIIPFIENVDFSTNLHIKASLNCRFLSFNEHIGNLRAGVFSVFKFKRGRYLFSFINEKGETSEVKYEVDNKADDYLLIDFDTNLHQKSKRMKVCNIIYLSFGSSACG